MGNNEDDGRPRYRQSNGYHFCLLFSTLLCLGLLTFFMYSLCIDNLSYIFISFVSICHAFLLSSFGIYQCRKAKIMEMIDEDLETGFSNNEVTKDDIFDSTTLILTRFKLCSYIVEMADYIDRTAINAIEKEQRRQRMSNAVHTNAKTHTQI